MLIGAAATRGALTFRLGAATRFACSNSSIPGA